MTYRDAPLEDVDPEIWSAITAEERRQSDGIELIASENFVSRAGRRYYGGCEFVDNAESLAIARAKTLFGAEHVNVQPHSGTSANMAVYWAMLRPGDPIMGMDFAAGGHLSHGHRLSYSGRDFAVVSYGVDRDSELIDYDEAERLAKEHRPKLIVCGASAYSRLIDYQRFRAIADDVGAVLLADIAHIAGLVAADLIPSPVPHSQFVSTTTHKTLRGPRGGIVMCEQAYAKRLDKGVFPGIQGGPLMHIIAATAVAFKEASQPAFRQYQQAVKDNAALLSEELAKRGLRIVSGGTDNHVFLVDLTPIGLTGQQAEEALDRAGITVNKNSIPYDPKPPMVTSGMRLGTPAVTSRGMRSDEMMVIAQLIVEALSYPDSPEVGTAIRKRVRELCDGFPLYAPTGVPHVDQPSG